MDSNDRRQRQSNPSGYASQQGLIQASPQYPATSSADRFRQNQLSVQSPTSAPTTARAGNIAGYTYPYGEGGQFSGSAMNAPPLQYQTEYAQEPQRSQQQQQYQQQYGSNILYNVPSQQNASPQSPYEPVQPYQPRQTAAIEVLANQFTVPQTYYESGPTSVPNSALPGQNVPSQYTPMSYTTQSPVGRDSLASAYATGMTDPTQSSPQGGYAQSSYPAQPDSALDTAYGQYQTELRRTFECVRDSRLAEAGNSLIHISDWLLGNAEALGKCCPVVLPVTDGLKLTRSSP